MSWTYNQPAYDVGKTGQGILSVYLPFNDAFKPLRAELLRCCGRGTAIYGRGGKTVGIEWDMSEGTTALRKVGRLASWKQCLGGGTHDC